MTAYRKFRKWCIGFRNQERLFTVLPIKKKIYCQLTDLIFFWHVTVNTHIFLFGLSIIFYWIFLHRLLASETFMKFRWLPFSKGKTIHCMYRNHDYFGDGSVHDTWRPLMIQTIWCSFFEKSSVELPFSSFGDHLINILRKVNRLIYAFKIN
jgi:hypothetical protein